MIDIYTKVFFANLVAIMFFAAFDRLVLDDKIEKAIIIGFVVNLWASLSFISIPVWLIYMIISM